MTCKVGAIAQSEDITDGDRRALSQALIMTDDNENYVWSAKALANAITQNTEFSVGETTVKLHRRQLCGCD